MFKIESNIDQFKLQVKLNLEQLIKSDKVLRQAALDTVVLISDRVQQRGELSSGEKIKSPTSSNVKNKKENKKKGAYSYQYGKKREEEGLQTDHIDLTFTGDMMGDLVPVPEGKNSYAVGFRGKLSSDKADWNERKFGKIFELSSKELKIIRNNVIKNINEIINSRNR